MGSVHREHGAQRAATPFRGVVGLTAGRTNRCTRDLGLVRSEVKLIFSALRSSPLSDHMFLNHPFSLTGAVILALLYFLSETMLKTYNQLAVSEPWSPRIAIFAMAPVAAAFSYTLPRLRARWFIPDAGVPYHAYVLPRWMICLLSTSLVGSGIGLVAAGIVDAQPALEMGLVHCVSWLAFAYSASVRCRKPAAAEFSVQWLPRSPLRWR